MAAKRDNVSLELSERARAFLDSVIARRRMSKKDAVEALLENLAGMPESVQDVFLGSVPADLRPAYLGRTLEHFREVLGKPGEAEEVAHTDEGGNTTYRKVPTQGRKRPSNSGAH